jgi:hypothetical protein
VTTLCAIPGCRIRNRHLPDCAGEQCAGCLPRVTEEGHVCDACIDRTADQLEGIVVLAPDARLVAAGLVHRGSDASSGKPASRPPLNDAATDTLAEIQTAITTIAREIAETRGLQAPSARSGAGDPLAGAAQWLTGQLGWLRHALDEQGGVYAAGVFTEIRENLSRLRGIVDGRAGQKYLGPCGVVRRCEGLEPDDWPEGDCGNHEPHEAHESEPCDGDVYGRPGARAGRCRTCGAEHDQGERRTMLDERTADLAAPARDIAYSLDISVKTIRSWATEVRTETGYVVRKAKLAAYYRRGEHVLPWTERPDGMSDAAWTAEVEARGPRLHYVGDVRKLAKEAAARRVENEIRRKREGAAA